MIRLIRAALAGALLVCAAPAAATTFYSGLDRAITDSVLVGRQHGIPRPAFNTTITEPWSGARLTRIGGDHGAAVLGSTGGTWYHDARHHYSKDQPWSTNEKWYWLEQRNTDLSGTPSWTAGIFDSTGTMLWSNDSDVAPYSAILDSCTEVRWHPVAGFDSIMVGWIQDSKKLIWFNAISNVVLRSWVIGDLSAEDIEDHDEGGGQFGISEGTISDDGRWIVLCSTYDDPIGDSKTDKFCVVDMMYPQDTDADGDTLGGRVGPLLEIPAYPAVFPHDDSGRRGRIGNANISTRGTYVLIKYGGVPEMGRIFHRGGVAGVDTSSLNLFPHTMAALGIRNGAAKDSTLGWIVSMSHPDMNETTSGVEVLVGIMRNSGGGYGHSQDDTFHLTWCESSSSSSSDGCNDADFLPHGKDDGTFHTGAKTDSGTVIMVELATGLHRHVSSGKRFGLSGLEASAEHTSGRAHKMRGWHWVSYNYDAARSYIGEIIAWKLDGHFGAGGEPSHSAIRYGMTRSMHASSAQYRAEAHPCPSPTGRRVMFVSNWCEDPSTNCASEDVFKVKSYIMDARTTGAKEYWITANPADSANTGFSASFPTTFARWSRIANANNGSNIVAHVLGGEHEGFPAPVYVPQGGKRYFVYGTVTDTLGYPVLARAGTAVLSMPYMSFHAVRVRADLYVRSPARFDTLRNTIIEGKLGIDGADHVVFADNTIWGHQLAIGRDPAVTDKSTVGLKFLTNRFRNLLANVEPGIYVGSSDAATVANRRRVDSLTFGHNTVAITNPGPTGGASLIAIQHATNSSFLHNDMRLFHNGDGNGGSNPQLAFVQRDSSLNNVFSNNRMVARGTGLHHLRWSDAGTLPRTVAQTQIDSCYLWTKNGVPMRFSDGADRCSLTYNTVVAYDSVGAPISNQNWPSLKIGDNSDGTGFRGRNVIDHNTFVGNGRGQIQHSNMGVVCLGVRSFLDLAGTDSIKFTNNVLANIASSSGAFQCGLNVDLTDIGGNAPAVGMRSFFTSDQNAYWVPSFLSTPGDRSISWVQPNGIRTRVRPEGNAGATWRKNWAANQRARGDTLSLYGSIQFDGAGPDSAFAVEYPDHDSLFSPRPGRESVALNTGRDGEDIGSTSALGLPLMVLSAIDAYFGETPETVGLPDTARITITNIGDEDLELSGLLEEDPDLTVSFTASTVAPGETKELVLIYNPSTVPGPKTITVNFNANDPALNYQGSNPDGLTGITVFVNMSEGPPPGGP